MTIDPQNNINNYVDQWKQANAQYDTDYQWLLQMIQEMLAAAQSGNASEAYQIAEMAVMPGAMNVQGDSMGQLAATMNLSSACQEFTTDAQNDLNGGSKITDAQAAEFVKLLKEVYAIVQQQMSLPPGGKAWMSKDTAANILDAISKICEPFSGGSGNPNDLDPQQVHDEIQWAISDPTGINPWNNNLTGQQTMQNIQAGFTEWNNTESAQSQGLQAQEQFASNTYNQYMNACTDIFKSTQQFVQNMVQNQKAQ